MTNHYIVIMRHAQAASPSGVRDLDRPLTAHGIDQAQQAAPFIQEYAPQLTWCSPAARALETYSHLGLNQPPSAVLPDLYDGHSQALADLLQGIPALIDEPSSGTATLIVSHIPIVSILTELLLGRQTSEEVHFGTATVAAIALPSSAYEPGQSLLHAGKLVAVNSANHAR